MNLYIKISKVELNQYNKEFLDCITHNSKNSYIKNVFIYTNCKEYRCSINNIKIIYKEKLDDFFIISDSKFTKGPIIYSNPFIKFGEDLFKISENELNKYILVNKDYKIYLNDIKITKSQNEVKFLNKEEKSIRLSHISMGIISFTDDSESIIKKPTVSTTPTKRSKKLDVIIVSVDYNDLLILTLQKNRKIFHNITVVTSKTDQKCKEICDKFGVSCIQTDIMYDNNSTFNKGKAINVGINSIENPDLILLLDADIIVENDINLHDLNDKYLYTSERIILPNYDSYLDYINNGVYNKLDRDQGLGFYQLFSINNNSINRNNPYPDNSSDASWSDLEFRNKFQFKKNIDRVIHLGDIAKNWKGRKTEEFTSEEILNQILEQNEFKINIYFDKIYCLNLDRRQDRWKKASEQFNRFNINVERWSAIDGDSLDNKLLDYYNPDGLKGEEASILGIPENKNTIGCLLSHLEIIKNAKENNYNRILIFEDDILLSDNFNEEVKKIFKLDWKLAYLGASQFDWSEIKIENNFYKSKKTLSTFAYAVESSIFDDILNIKSIKSIDNLLSELQIKFYGDCFTFYPNIVVSDVNKSDIREEKEMSSYSKMMRWELDKFTFINDSKSIIKKKEALDNLIELDKLFRELNVEYWLTCGTLLGFYRDNDFIAHDKDTDICVNSEHFNGYVLKRILSKGFKIHRCFGELEDGFEISFFRNGVKIDIFLFYKNEDKWYNSVYADFTSVDCLKFDYVYEPFEISENIFLGYSFKTPKNIEHFLKQQYGDNFKIPNKNWIWWKSPKNLKDTNIRIPYTNLDKLLEFNKNIHLDKLTILIKSFLRKDCVDRLVKSIRKYYKDIKIIIIDDSGDPDTYNFDYDDNIKTYNIEFDSGLSFGRNFGVSVIETEFFLLLDDDFEFTENTNLINWMEIMIDSDLDILGSDVIMNGKKMEYFGNFEILDDCLYYRNEKYEVNDIYEKCDFILNFFIARTKVIKKHKWDDELKLAEHTAFFYEHKGYIKVGHTKLISIDHQKINEGDYSIYRKRGGVFFNNWMIKKNIKKTVNLKGEITIRK